MSANIYWQPMRVSVSSLPTLAPQRFLDTLRSAGWSEGDSLDESYLSVLRGMASLYGGVDSQNPYLILAKAVEKHGSIRVWSEY